MITKNIGSNAGKILQRLDGGLTETNLQKIKSDCQLSTNEFFLALGWLAREGKIKFLDTNSKIYVFPTD